MDDIADEGDDDHSGVIVAAVHAVAGCILVYCVWKCCRRSPAISPAGEFTADAGHLQPRKRLLSGYLLWLCGGLFGAHHFYLGRLIHGIMACWTCNFFFAGLILDLFLLPAYVSGFNRRRVDPSAPLDGSRRLLLCRLPLTILTTVTVLAGVGLCVPSVLHRTGAVDIDRLRAQTLVNPYDTLGISRSAELAEAKSAYRKLSLKWHPDRNQNCGKECDHKMSEITKAFDLIKQRKSYLWEDKTWKSWLEDIGRDWWFVLEVVSEKWQDDKKKEQQTQSNQKANDARRKSSEL